MKILPLNYNVMILGQNYEINTSRVNPKAYASIDQVTNKGVNPNEAVTEEEPMQIDPSLALDLNEVYNALANPNSRIKFLMMMNKFDILNLLFMLDKDKLILGLNFFSHPKLLEMILSLPKELLIQALLMHMDQKTLLSMMPQKELMRILSSGKIKEQMIVDAIKNLPTHILVQMLESILGETMGPMKHLEVINKLQHLKKNQLLRGLMSLPSGSILEIVYKFTSKDPSLLGEMSKYAIQQPFTRFQKSTLVQCFSVLDSSEIIKMLGGLPKELLAQVACMIDPGMLAEIFASEFPQLLAGMAS